MKWKSFGKNLNTDYFGIISVEVLKNAQIDLMLLRADVIEPEIDLLCSTANLNRYGFVCIPPSFTQIARNYLADTDVCVCTIVSFPMGYVSNQVKLLEISDAIENGAHEIEVMLNLGNIHANNWKAVESEILSFKKLTDDEDIALTIIIELDLWDELKLKHLCQISKNTEVDFLKTSTDTLQTTINPQKIELLAQYSDKNIGIKACGKILTRENATACIEAGAVRICSSFSL